LVFLGVFLLFFLYIRINNLGYLLRAADRPRSLQIRICAEFWHVPCRLPLPLFTEAVGDKRYRRSPTNSGPVAIACGMPAVMIDSPAVREVFGSSKDDDIIVVDRGSKRGSTGLKVSTVWEHLINDIRPNT
jgi:hypothetical protein